MNDDGKRDGAKWHGGSIADAAIRAGATSAQTERTIWTPDRTIAPPWGPQWAKKKPCCAGCAEDRESILEGSGHHGFPIEGPGITFESEGKAAYWRSLSSASDLNILPKIVADSLFGGSRNARIGSFIIPANSPTSAIPPPPSPNQVSNCNSLRQRFVELLFQTLSTLSGRSSTTPVTMFNGAASFLFNLHVSLCADPLSPSARQQLAEVVWQDRLGGAASNPPCAPPPVLIGERNTVGLCRAVAGDPAHGIRGLIEQIGDPSNSNSRWNTDAAYQRMMAPRVCEYDMQRVLWTFKYQVPSAWADLMNNRGTVNGRGESLIDLALQMEAAFPVGSTSSCWPGIDEIFLDPQVLIDFPLSIPDLYAMLGVGLRFSPPNDIDLLDSASVVRNFRLLDGRRPVTEMAFRTSRPFANP